MTERTRSGDRTAQDIDDAPSTKGVSSSDAPLQILPAHELWKEAYKALQEKEAKLLDAYEKALLTSDDSERDGKE